MKRFTYVSLFAGIGGMTMGLEPLGGVGVAAYEYDPTEKRRQYAQEAHKLLHPLVPIYGDVCAANTDEMPDFDVLCFTPPCQAFSVAGKRGGFSDTRGTLTFEALRIAKEKQPKILFMENVKGLVNHDKGNTMGTILHAINEIGYTVDFTVLNSKYFDVAQNRERVYLVAVRDDLIDAEQWSDAKGSTMLPKAKRKYLDEGVRTFNFDWPEQVEVRTRLRDFLDTDIDEKYYLTEDKTAALVKQLEDGLAVKEATKAGFTKAAVGDTVNIAFPNSTTRRGRVGKQMANTIEASGINQGVVEKSTLQFFIENSFRQEANGNGFRFSPHVEQNATIAKTITTRGGGRMDDNFIISGIETDKTQFTFDSKNDELSKVGIEEVRPCLTTERLENRQNGRRFKDDGEEAFTLTAIGVALGSFPKYRIRKLTPTECLRLQAVPEDAIQKLTEKFSVSRCYKFAGNGLTTTVIRAIGERLIKYL